MAVANVYYSISPYGTSDIKTGSPTISISSGVATLSVSQTGNIGQGCKITYDTTSICYISSVNSATSFDVVTATGGTPGDVTGKTVDSIAHVWASLSDAEANATGANYLNTADLTSGDGFILNIACYYDHDDSTADTTTLTISGYTTSSTCYIRIYTPTGGTHSINTQRHAGVWSSTKYLFTPTTAWGACFTINDDSVRVHGLQVDNLSASNPDGIEYDGSSVLYITHSIIKECRWALDLDTAGDATKYIYNNIIYDYTAYGKSSREREE